jgi:uncharacterized membrane protein
VEFIDAMEAVARGFELVAIAIFIGGGAWTAIRAVTDRLEGEPVFRGVRRRFGQSLILGVEVLVAADIIKTVTVDATIENVLALGVLVLVRTLISFSISTEINGIVPWRRAEFKAQVREEAATKSDDEDYLS